MNGKIIETKKGKISGVQMEGHTLFKGIPYAKPPVGELRWRPPQEAEAWDGVYRAERFPNKCMQQGRHNGFYQKEFGEAPEFDVPSSEDCLYLNIWAPDGENLEKLPVAFYIHGGAFMGGHCSEVEFDGAGYCKRGVILVTINYRCNIFGFLAHPWLSAESDKGISGNYGILDQIAALRWVRDNIAAFGGDPDNITIFGQSAGSMSVQTLVSTRLTEGLVSKAILQSAGSYGGGINRDLTLDEAMDIGGQIAGLSSAQSLEALRALPAEAVFELAEKAQELFPMSGGLIFVPNIDGYLLEDGYDRLTEQDQIHKIPYMIGSTEDDLSCREEDIRAGIKSSLYRGCIGWSLKNEENGNAPAYVYFFSRHLPGDDAGAFHSSELWYMFETLQRCWRPMTERDRELSGRMMDFWTAFMKTGNPNGQGDEWKPCTKEDPFVMELN